jgi:hypothetical protein
MSCTDTWLLARISATQKQIEAYEDAITALTTGGVQSYSLNTGQTTQQVTKFDLMQMQQTLDSLYNRYDILQQRCNGSGSFNMMGY